MTDTHKNALGHLVRSEVPSKMLIFYEKKIKLIQKGPQ